MNTLIKIYLVLYISFIWSDNFNLKTSKQKRKTKKKKNAGHYTVASAFNTLRNVI